MHKRTFWLHAHPARGVLEAWGVGFAMLFLLSRLEGDVPGAVLGNGMAVLCGAAGMWAVLRIRLPAGRWKRRLLWEVGVGAALSLVMALGMLGPASLHHWEDVWLRSSLRGMATFAGLLLGTGPGYVMARGVVRLWLYWNRLRRQRMLWSLTHAHLTVIVVTFGLAVLASFTYTALTDGLMSMDGESVGPALASRLLVTIFPMAMVVFFAAAAVLAAVLPPSALFSFLVARRTTQRLEKLAAATAALRSGDYGTRVEIEGADEVAQLQADFNTMAGELEQTLEQLEAERDKVAALLQARRELVAGVSHELRTPVATVRGYLESLQQAASAGVSPEILARDLTVIESEVLRLQRLIDDLFTLSRAKVNGLDLELGPVDLGTVIRRRVAAMAPLAWERERVELVAEASQDLPLVQTDEGRFDQVLVNLLRNALRHAAPGGIVAVMATAEPDTIRVEVHDTGEGIPPEDLARVWERFYRGSDSRVRDPRGAGLGLALVKELTEAMGGRVAVESTLGKGSVFTVWLPRSKT